MSWMSALAKKDAKLRETQKNNLLKTKRILDMKM